MTEHLAGLAVEFEAMRPRLFGIAYRMLGSVVEAQDVVQDVWIRWQATDRSEIRSPLAFLTTATTRLSITVAASARTRREVYIGPWIPEPVLTGNDPALGAEKAEALELGLLMLLERLTPNERAVYVLREAFDYSFSDIAGVLETSEPNARQLARRARVHLDGSRTRQVPAAEHDRLLRAFLAAAQSGDLEGLETFFAADVVVYSDGGGIVTAARRPIRGRDNVTRFFAGILAKVAADVSVDVVHGNGEEVFVLSQGGTAVILCAMSVGDTGIARVYFVLNPDKLTAVQQL